MSAVMAPLLDRLAEALDEERHAILEHDVEALIRSTQKKLESLRALEAGVPGFQPDAALVAIGSADVESRLQQLSQLNHANGALLARRRREVNWALRHLGRSESAVAYDAHGQTDNVKATRPIAVA
ncbi:flagellar protein FlgN [Luteimonas cucumeris]|nr:flagellar protein FlgN [Luteimonas cucumeris]